MQKNEKMKNLTVKKLDNTKNVIIIEYWFIWVIFGEKIAKTAIFAFLGKNRYFLKKNALPRTRRGGVNFFVKNKYFGV